MISDTAAAMATREALHDLREMQVSCWQRQAVLTRIERELPLLTTAERSAYVDELLDFTRACLNRCMQIVRSSIFAAEQTQAQQVLTSEVERVLRPWMPERPSLKVVNDDDDSSA